MLLGVVARASASPDRENPVNKPIDQVNLPLVKGGASPDPNAKKLSNNDWPTYRSDRWRSGSSASTGPKTLETKWSTKLADPGALPDGPIIQDWRENPFVKGPISAPTIAQGSVFVARPDAHEVISLDADTGREQWRFTARGRVDLPPTIHRGLALFGCHAGYV